MLKALFGYEFDDAVNNVDKYFNRVYEPEWFKYEDPIIKRIIKEIDGCEIHGMNVISPVFNSISIRDISGGSKTLIMMYKMDDFCTDLTNIGSNCEKLLLEIADKKDIRVSVNGLNIIFDGIEELKALCLNSNELIHNGFEWQLNLVRYIR